MCYYSFLFFSRKKMLRFAELMWVKKKGRSVLRVESGYSPRGGYRWIFCFVGSVDNIRYYTTTTPHTHTHSHTYISIPFPSKWSPAPALGRKQQSGTEVRSGTVIGRHPRRSDPHDHLSLFLAFASPTHTSTLIYYTTELLVRVSVIFPSKRRRRRRHSRNVSRVSRLVSIIIRMKKKRNKTKNKRQVKRIHIVCVCVCPCESVCVW